MFDTQYDLPLTGYGLLGLFFVGTQIWSLQTALFLAALVVALAIAAALVVALFKHLLGPVSWAHPPHMGGNSDDGDR